MRPALTARILPLIVLLGACGTDSGEATGPERRTAAGEVLGGEVSDEMIPMDLVRSTAPPAPRAAASGRNGGGEAPAVADPAAGERLPSPEVSGGPEPLASRPGSDDAAAPPQT